MAIELHTIEKYRGATKKSKRVGRGNSSQKGTYSSRGMKGQRSRSGGKSGLKTRGFKQSLQKIPKNRGFKSPHIKKETIILSTLDKNFIDKDIVTPAILKKKSLISSPKNGVKIVATGEITKKITVKNCLASKKAVELIEKAGGTVLF